MNVPEKLGTSVYYFVFHLFLVYIFVMLSHFGSEEIYAFDAKNQQVLYFAIMVVLVFDVECLNSHISTPKLYHRLSQKAQERTQRQRLMLDIGIFLKIF